MLLQCAHVVIRRILRPVCLGTYNVADGISKLVGTPKGNFLRRPRYPSSHKSDDKQDANRDCEMLVARSIIARLPKNQEERTRKPTETNIDK